VFFAHKRRYFADHPVATHLPSANDLLARFLSDGILIVPDFHPQEIIVPLREKLLSMAQAVKAGTQPPEWSTYTYPDDGIYRIRSVETLVPEAKAILDHPTTNRLAHEYLGYPIRHAVNYLDYKPDSDRHDDTTVPHMDSWLSQVKIFTLLSDVTDANAPLVYWKRSQRDAQWRWMIDYFNWLGWDYGSAGICPPHMLRERAALPGPNGIEKLTVTGRAGTVILADVRGFHRASHLRSGYRLEIVQKFTVVPPR